MPSVALSPVGNGVTFLTSAGVVLQGGKINTYAAGTSTPTATYTTSSGAVANANPIILGSNGVAPNEIWLIQGTSYKFVVTDASNNVLMTLDNLTGINDVISNPPAEWLAQTLPTYISATSFSVAGNQTSTFDPGRRVKSTNTGGTIYSTVSTSVYSSVPNTTTVTVVNDAGTLDSGLSAVSVGILDPAHPSAAYPILPLISVAGTANAITAAGAALQAGQTYSLVPTAVNTGATTLAVNGGSALAIQSAGLALVGDELQIGLQVLLYYTGTVFQIVTQGFQQAGTSSVLRTVQAKTREIVSAKDFGAVGNNLADDTAAIQAGINYCRINKATLYVPIGTYIISNLDCTAASGLRIVGAGRGNTNFTPKVGTTSYGTATGHLFDCSGSFFLNFEDFSVGAFNQTPVPTTAFFLAQTAGNPSNYLYFKNVYVSGKYSVAPLYNTSVESSRMVDCEFYNYNAAAVSVMYFSKSNIASLSSAFVTVIASSLLPSDWTFVGCEFHDFTNNTGGQVLNWDQVQTLRFIGGNISSAANAGQYGALQNGATNIEFLGTTFYSDTGPAPNYIFNNVGGITGVSFDQCSLQYNTAIQTGTGAFIPGVSGRQVNFHTTPGTAVAANSTNYVGIAGHDSTDANAQIVMAHAGIISNFRVQTTASPGGITTYTFTMRKNSVDQTVTCQTTGSAVTGSDTTHSFQFALGDLISLKIVTSAGANTTQLTAAFDILPIT